MLRDVGTFTQHHDECRNNFIVNMRLILLDLLSILFTKYSIYQVLYLPSIKFTKCYIYQVL